MAKKDTGQKVDEERYCKGGWAKPDDPIYKQGWTIAPIRSGRRPSKASRSSSQAKPRSEDTITEKPSTSTLEDDITDPNFLSDLSNTRLGTTLEPRPSDAFKVGGWRLARLPQSSSNETLNRRQTMSKTQKKPQSKRRVPGHLRSTDRVSYRMLTSEDDPHYSLHTMAFSMREAPSKKKTTPE